jgi:hypothetical protein
MLLTVLTEITGTAGEDTGTEMGLEIVVIGAATVTEGADKVTGEGKM